MEALEALSRLAPAPRTPVPPAADPTRPPVPRQAPEPASIPPKPAADAPPAASEPQYRCLFDGYILHPASGWRCSECGRAYQADELARWFSGAARQRYDTAIWLAWAALLLHLWILPETLGVYGSGFAYVVALPGLALGLCWTHYRTARGHFDSRGGRFALAGLALSSILLFASLRNFWRVGETYPAEALATLDALCALLLLLALTYDGDKSDLHGAAASRWLAGSLLVSAPLAVGIAASLFSGSPIGAIFQPQGIPPSPFSAGASLFARGTPLLFAWAVWGLVVWRLTAFRRRIFGRWKSG